MEIKIDISEEFFAQILLARGVPYKYWRGFIERAKEILPDMLAEHVEDEVERLVEEMLETI